MLKVLDVISDHCRAMRPKQKQTVHVVRTLAETEWGALLLERSRSDGWRGTALFRRLRHIWLRAAAPSTCSNIGAHVARVLVTPDIRATRLRCEESTITLRLNERGASSAALWRTAMFFGNTEPSAISYKMPCCNHHHQSPARMSSFLCFVLFFL